MIELQPVPGNAGPAGANLTPSVSAPLTPIDLDAIPDDRPWVIRNLGLTMFLFGLVVGPFVGAGLSAMKPNLGIAGVILVVVGVTALAGAVLGLKALLPLLFPSTPEQPLRAFRLGRSLKAFSLWFFGLLVPCWIVLVAELFGPPRGHVRTLMARAENVGQPRPAPVVPEEPKPVPVPPPAPVPPAPAPPVIEEDPKPVFEKAKWNKVEFALANPTHRLVGLRNIGTAQRPQYEVVAKADDEIVSEALKFAWGNRLPVVASDPDLARRVFARYEVGNVLAREEGKLLAQMAVPRTYIPREAKIVSFVDPRTSRLRVGHMVQDLPEGFSFCDLIPVAKPDAFLAEGEPPFAPPAFETEIIPLPADERNAAKFRILTTPDVKGETDLMQYGVYTLLAKLQASAKKDLGAPKRPSIYVDRVMVESEDLHNSVQEMRGTLKNRQGLSRILVDGLKEAVKDPLSDTTSSIDRAVKNYHENKLIEKRLEINATQRKIMQEDNKAIAYEIERLRQSVRTCDEVTQELRHLLIRSGVSLVERSDRARHVFRSFLNGEKWMGEAVNKDVAVDCGLVEATHILLMDVGMPKTRDTYRLSMRLVDVQTGEIIWEEYGDRKGVLPIERSYNIRGTWSIGGPGGDSQFTMTETDGIVRMSVAKHPVYASVELEGTREGNKITVTKCVLVYKKEVSHPPGKKPFAELGEEFPVKAELTIVNGSQIVLGLEQVYREWKRMPLKDGRPQPPMLMTHKAYSTFQMVRE